jgi:Mor family transcriptional regulator
MADQPIQYTEGELLLESLAGIVVEAAGKVLELKPEVAKMFADEVATRFSEEWGGRVRYIPKGRVFRTSALYRQLYERFNGKNVKELANEVGVSEIHMYRILARERARDRAERQAPLPGVEG